MLPSTILENKGKREQFDGDFKHKHHNPSRPDCESAIAVVNTKTAVLLVIYTVFGIGVI